MADSKIHLSPLSSFWGVAHCLPGIRIDVLNRVWGEVLKTYDVAKALGQVATSMFLALGKSDEMPYILWDNLKGKFPNLFYNLFEKSGHYPMLEEQPIFDKRLVDSSCSETLGADKFTISTIQVVN